MKLLKGEILSNEKYGPDIYRMEIFSPYIVKNTGVGQFVNIKCSPEGVRDPLLRRPFSVFDIEEKFNVFSILYIIKGRGTRYMSNLIRGDMLDFSGPLGKPVDLAGSRKNLLLVGGGMGIAPLNLLSKIGLGTGRNILVLAGFKDSSLLGWERDLVRMGIKYRIFSEDGTWGEKGLVCDHLFDEHRTFTEHDVFCCGPVPMLKVLQGQLGSENISATVFLEEKMACGMGACHGCVVKLKKGRNGFDYKRVCKEGPAFDLSEVVFDK
ncbi:MAG: dihydroorotate dehydrogenase electron transfer subunit [Actinobacteria bacterium]|nr:dihydroorotate dehydrogenase electron transfer subunit [Actinomycetota bacterium]